MSEEARRQIEVEIEVEVDIEVEIEAEIEIEAGAEVEVGIEVGDEVGAEAGPPRAAASAVRPRGPQALPHRLSVVRQHPWRRSERQACRYARTLSALRTYSWRVGTGMYVLACTYWLIRTDLRVRR